MAVKENTTCWTNEETRVLISLYGDQEFQNKFGEVYRNQNVFEDLAKALEGRGYRKTANQCRGKIKNLKAKYKQVRDHNARSSRTRISCSFFEELDAILRDYPSSKPKLVLDSVAAFGEEETPLSGGDSEEEVSISTVGFSSTPRKRQVRFSARHDIILLREVITQNPFASKEPGPSWARVGEVITAALQDENFVVDARRCRERTMLLLDYYKKQDFPSLRRFGTERLYAQKEDLLHEVLELEAERGLLASGEGTEYQGNECMIQTMDEQTLVEEEKPNIAITQTHTAEPEDDHKEMAEISAPPTAKQPCQCCCQTYSEILSFLEKRSEAEQRLREEELALRREELEIQRSKIALERERLGAERREREQRFELESQERQVILDLLKDRVLKG